MTQATTLAAWVAAAVAVRALHQTLHRAPKLLPPSGPSALELLQLRDAWKQETWVKEHGKIFQILGEQTNVEYMRLCWLLDLAEYINYVTISYYI